MRKLLLAAAGIGIAASVMATPAHACITPSGGPFDTFQVCLGPDIDIRDIIRT